MSSIFRPLIAVLASVPLIAASASAAPYPDVPSTHVNARAIEYLRTEKIMEGYADGMFRPDANLNRAELMKILTESSQQVFNDQEYRDCFPDVRDEWFAQYVCFAKSRDWVSGYPNGRFQPGQNVTMAEAVKMVVNSRWARPTMAPQENDSHNYDINAWYAPYVATALHKDIISYEALSQLNVPISRQRIAELIYRTTMASASVRLDFSSLSDCRDTASLTAVRIETDTANLKYIPQKFVGIDAQGKTCTLIPDANPYSRVSDTYDHYLLVPITYEESPPVAYETVTVPLRNGNAYFIGGHETSSYRTELWSLDVRGGPRLYQGPFLHTIAGTHVISPDYSFLAFVNPAGDAIEVLHLQSNQAVTIATVSQPLSFGSYETTENSYGGVAGLMLEPNIKFTSPRELRYSVYDRRKKDGRGYFAEVEVKTTDVQKLFPSLHQ